MITLQLPRGTENWPTSKVLRRALAAHPELTGTVRWGFSPCDKFEALQRLSAAGIPVPEWRTDCPTSGSAASDIWLGRRRSHHSGRDILFPPSRGADRSYRQLYANRDFWVKFISSQRELRVHVWGEHADRIGFKRQTAELPRDKKLRRVVRSSERGWELCYNYEELCAVTSKEDRKEIRRLAREACKALGVVGGAVDILQASDGRFFVLELNTAPALGDLTLEHYVKRICEWVQQPTPTAAEATSLSVATTTERPRRATRSATAAAPPPFILQWDDEEGTIE